MKLTFVSEWRPKHTLLLLKIANKKSQVCHLIFTMCSLFCFHFILWFTQWSPQTLTPYQLYIVRAKWQESFEVCYCSDNIPHEIIHTINELLMHTNKLNFYSMQAIPVSIQ